MQIAAEEKLGGFRSAHALAHFLDRYRACFADLPHYAEHADVPTSFGTVRAYRFAGQGDGQNTPIMLLPGRNAPTPVYGTNVAPLLRHRDVYYIDLLGEPGLSVQTAPIADAADQARWLEQALAGLGLAQVHLCGISIGGWAAVNHAVAHARKLLPQGQVELWAQASHALNGEYPEEIAERAQRFWTEIDAS
ncbi:hypothetical protein BH11ACT6_BH11ACT6_07610 [soil metagenome]